MRRSGSLGLWPRWVGRRTGRAPGSHHLGASSTGSGTDLSTCSGSRGLIQEWMARHRDSQGMEQEFYSMKLQGFLLLCLSQLM